MDTSFNQDTCLKFRLIRVQEPCLHENSPYQFFARGKWGLGRRLSLIRMLSAIARVLHDRESCLQWRSSTEGMHTLEIPELDGSGS